MANRHPIPTPAEINREQAKHHYRQAAAELRKAADLTDGKERGEIAGIANDLMCRAAADSPPPPAEGRRGSRR